MTSPRLEHRAGGTGSTEPGGHAPRALAMMVEALGLLDLDGGAEPAGAHLDLAIHRLREWIANKA